MSNTIITSKSVPQVQKRLLKELKKVGSWERLAQRYSDEKEQINRGTLWRLAKQGQVPASTEMQYRLGLRQRPIPDAINQAVEFLAARDPGEAVEGPRVYARGGRRVEYYGYQKD